jgi:O-methyltransferase
MNIYLLDFLKKFWRAITSAEVRNRIARVRYAISDRPMILNPTYADDGLISSHVTTFLVNNKFLKSYEVGKLGGSLVNHPGDIHFRAYIICWAARYAVKLRGDFVECGVGKALLSRTLVQYIDFQGLDKTLFLFDTYEGIPLGQAADMYERENMALLNDTHFSSNYYDEVKKSFENYPNVSLIKGNIPESLDQQKINLIAYLSIDLNNAHAEISCINFFWSKLVIGGIVILDDYAYSEEFKVQKNAWDEWAATKNIEILTLPTGQGLIIKN